MKKKLIITIIVILIIFILGILFKYIDSAHVRAGIEPKLAIKFVSKDRNKVTYWGLGYKVIRYVSVSPNEPYKNNRGVKFGNWFMTYELTDSKFKIIDNVKVCDEALEEIYRNQDYIYYLPCMKSNQIIIKFNDGNTYKLREVLEKEILTIDELIQEGLYLIKYNND